ncbi:SigB/SigF/SigG family RNA polymerase sigma factor [Streptomyces griseus]|uniref:SigB/SigF/SigG family RNA polymerase sigma factor n=1 Tax=Streptomyces griseus TaxID=1911 RepID=UPI0008405B13|nr:SigB/SigF/SigG family RNA polymerase sigma factor [Streptomyces griseus]
MCADDRRADPATATAFQRLAVLPPGPERDRLRDDLIRAWLPMAHRLAGRFRNRGESLEDLRQVAAVGLVNAVDRYDPGLGNAFASYAVPTITGEIKRHFRDRTWSVHVPRRVQDLRNVVRAAHAELSAGGGTVTDRRIAAYTGLSDEEVRQGSEALHSFSTLSTDADIPGTEGGVSLGESLGRIDTAFDLVIDRESVKPGLRLLSERERHVLYLRFFVGITQSAIAAELGISQMHVSRLISKSCRSLRDGVLRERGATEGARRPLPTRGPR